MFSVLAHAFALLYFGLLTRSCHRDPPAPSQQVTYVELTLDTEDGPAGTTTQPANEENPQQGALAMHRDARRSDRLHPAPPTLQSSKQRPPEPRKTKQHSRTLTRKAEPKPKAKPKPSSRPASRAKPSPTKKPPASGDRSPLDMRASSPHPSNRPRVSQWERWENVDPQLALQLRMGALPQVAKFYPSTTALASVVDMPQKVVQDGTTEHLRITAYRDGGRRVWNRTKRNVEIPPRPGEETATQGLVITMKSGVRLPRGVPRTLNGIANLEIPGMGTGKVACDLFRWYPSPDATREVTLFVDTSGSMADKINHAQICAAGVARSALRRGYRVAVFNFSDFSYYQPPTRDAKKLHRILALTIGGFTALPKLQKKHMGNAATARDFVIVSDGLFNKFVKGSVKSHRRALRANRSNRAFFYLFGNTREAFYRDSRTVYARLARIGYRTRGMLSDRPARAVATKSR
ncbi:MAG: hypothetical protein ABI333_02485 [bacterium]